jgi:glycosyltransferase involved in cell wall biosynthesis
VLPCYNEEAAIAETVAGFRAALPGATIYVYDNNSRDRTVEIARGAGRRRPYRSSSRARGNVVRRMFADIDADIYVMADGDLTYDPKAAPAMVAMLVDQQLDMVVGTRQHEHAGAYRGGHVIGNKLFTGLLAGLFGRSFSDIFQGYRVFSRRFVKSFPVLSAGVRDRDRDERPRAGAQNAGRASRRRLMARARRSESKLSTYRDGGAY